MKPKKVTLLIGSIVVFATGFIGETLEHSMSAVLVLLWMGLAE